MKQKIIFNFFSLIYKASLVSILTLNFLLSGIAIHAATTNYYVSTTGDDANDGTSLATPFRTIQKCNNVSTPGTVCNIRGGTYREAVGTDKQGTATDPITFQPYNNEKVTIDARDTIDPSSWTLYDADKGIYKTNAMNWDLGLGNNQIFIDSTPLHEARWPNIDPGYEELYKDSAYTAATEGGTYKLKGYTTDPASWNLKESDLATDPSNLVVDNSFFSTTSYNTNTTTGILEPLTNSSGVKFGYYNFQSLPPMDLTNVWVNGAVGENYGLQTSKVVNQVNNTLNIRYQQDANTLKYQPHAGDKMYFWGKLNFLDSPYEFFKDSNYLYIKPPNGKLPQDLNISVKKRSLVLYAINNARYLSFNNISTIGGKLLIQANSVTLESMDIKYLYHNTFREKQNEPWNEGFGIEITGEGNTIKNSLIKYSSTILVQNSGQKGKLENNIISYSGYFPTWSSASILNNNNSNENIIKNNTLTYSGRFALIPAGLKNKFIYNNISNSLALSKDGGGIYNFGIDYLGDETPSENEIAYNIISDNSDSDYLRFGIYLDYISRGYSVHHNIVYGFPESLMLTSPSAGHKFYNNTFISRRSSLLLFYPSYCITGQDSYFYQNCRNNLEFKNNIFTVADYRFSNHLKYEWNFNGILTFQVDEASQTISIQLNGNNIDVLGIQGADNKKYKFSFDPIDPNDLSKGRYIDQLKAKYPTGTVTQFTDTATKTVASSNAFLSSELSRALAIPDLSSLNSDFSPRNMSNSPIIDKGEVISGITDGFTGLAPDVGAVEYGKAFPKVGSDIFCAKNNCNTLTIPALSPQLTMESYTRSLRNWVKDTTPVIGSGAQSFDCYGAVRDNTDIFINSIKMYGLKESCVDAQKLAGENNQVYVTQQRYKEVSNNSTKFYTRTIYSYVDSGGNTKFYYPHKEYWLEWEG